MDKRNFAKRIARLLSRYYNSKDSYEYFKNCTSYTGYEYNRRRELESFESMNNAKLELEKMGIVLK